MQGYLRVGILDGLLLPYMLYMICFINHKCHCLSVVYDIVLLQIWLERNICHKFISLVAYIPFHDFKICSEIDIFFNG
jgi:hypothetical protein